MSPDAKVLLRQFSAAAAVALAVGFALVRARSAGRTGEEGASVWFYDESESRLYAAPRETIPPHQGIGGKPGDGVRAVVVAFRGLEADPKRRRIAYLETYKPDLKQRLERILAARASGKPAGEPVPPRDGEYFRTNDLVRRPAESLWHAAGSEEGARIIAEWRGWTGPNGEAPVVCVP